LELALLGKGNVAPNPLVGCVIVHNEKIIGEGYHKNYGGPHAEPNALSSVSDLSFLAKSTLYVNLEPCSHFGKTPPCANTIVSAGIKKVVIANRDPFAAVDGRGIKILQDKGIEVISGLLEKEGAELNKRFFTFHHKKRPFVILKWAQTQDGFIDRIRNQDESPLIISNSENSALVHLWRSEESAIMVGAHTVLMDNPSLTVRNVNGKNPIRICVDNEKTEIEWSKFNLTDQSAPTLIYNKTKSKKIENCEFISLPSLSLNNILQDLHSRNIQSIIIEGGSKLLNSFIELDLWDEARISTGTIKIEVGVEAPRIKGELKSNFSCGDKCNVSVFSPHNIEE